MTGSRKEERGKGKEERGKRKEERGSCSLRSKRFRTSLSRKLGREQKKRSDGGGGGQRRKRLPANPRILKN